MSETANPTGSPPASPEVVDFEAVLRPISEENPAGPDLRADFSPTSLYLQVKDARNAARAAERLVERGEDVPPPDWLPVLKLAPKLLAEQAKDLEVTAWYVEALVRRHGFAGLRDGYRLARELCERWWDTLHPVPDEEGLATRVAPLAGLNGEEGEGTLIAPIRKIPLTDGSGGVPWGVWEYEKATELERIPDPEERERRVAEGAVSLKMFEQAVRASGPEFYRTLKADLTAAKEEFARLTAFLDERCGAAAPPSSNVRAAIEKYEETLNWVARDFLAGPAEAPPAGTEAGSAAVGPGSAGGAGGPIQGREEAFRQLEAVADFFRRTEPHSPLSYTLEQAVRWGRMPLPDLLSELIPDEATRGQLFRLTGIRAGGPPPPA